MSALSVLASPFKVSDFSRRDAESVSVPTALDRTPCCGSSHFTGISDTFRRPPCQVQKMRPLVDLPSTEACSEILMLARTAAPKGQRRQGALQKRWRFTQFALLPYLLAQRGSRAGLTGKAGELRK
jgi:hypothetical protein